MSGPAWRSLLPDLEQTKPRLTLEATSAKLESCSLATLIQDYQQLPNVRQNLSCTGIEGPLSLPFVHIARRYY